MSESGPIPRLARKILVTLTGGAVAYFVATGINSTEVAYPLAASIFVGGVLFVALYLIEVDQRLSQVEQTFTEGFLKINEATRLFGRMEASSFSRDIMTQLVAHSTRIDPRSTPLAFRFAQGEINRLAKMLKDLSQGSDVPYDGEDRDWMLGLTANAKSGIDAVSLTTVDAGIDGGLWMSDLGQRYLQAQREAVRRGVKIRRIFVTDRAAAKDPGFLEKANFLGVCKMHSDMGIVLKMLDASEAPGTLAHTMFDFIVFDGAISYESTPAAANSSGKTQPIIINTKLVQDGERVKERVDRFEELWLAAHEIPVS